MKKPVIAVDIDDVLSASVESFVAFSNERWGTNLTPGDYNEHWAEMWKTDRAETERRAYEYHTSGVVNDYRAYDEAKAVLNELKTDYEMIAITSRQVFLERETRDWITKHYKDLFKDIQFAGILIQNWTSVC